MRRLAVMAIVSGVCTWGQGWNPVSAHVSLYFPQIADGGPESARWQTDIRLVNPGLIDANVEIKFYGDDGKPMAIDFGGGESDTHKILVPSYGSISLRSRMTGATAKTGWAVAQSDFSMTAMASFRLWLNGTATQEVTAPAVMPTYLYSSYANKDLGVALANPSESSPITLRIVLTDAEGYDSGLPMLMLLQPLGHTVFNVRDKFPQADGSDWSILIGSTAGSSNPFIAWTMNADASGTFSSLPNGSRSRPAMHKERIQYLWAQLLETAIYNEVVQPPPELVVATGNEMNAFADSGAKVSISLGLSQVLNESDHELAFVIAHQLGHIFQQQNGDSFIWDPDREKDANMWAIYLLIDSRFDPYAMPGAIGHLVVATGVDALMPMWEKTSRAAANASLKTQLEQSLTTIKDFCSQSAGIQALCNSLVSTYRPNVPRGGGVVSALPQSHGTSLNPALRDRFIERLTRKGRRLADR